MSYLSNEEYKQKNPTLCLPDDVQKTFSNAAQYHPLCGVSFEKPKPIHKLESMEEASLHADIVTVTCFEQLGKEEENVDAHQINLTSVGNLAYIALHHSDPKIKEKWKLEYNRLMIKQQQLFCVIS